MPSVSVKFHCCELFWEVVNFEQTSALSSIIFIDMAVVARSAASARIGCPVMIRFVVSSVQQGGSTPGQSQLVTPQRRFGHGLALLLALPHRVVYRRNLGPSSLEPSQPGPPQRGSRGLRYQAKISQSAVRPARSSRFRRIPRCSSGPCG